MGDSGGVSELIEASPSLFEREGDRAPFLLRRERILLEERKRETRKKEGKVVIVRKNAKLKMNIKEI